MELCQLDCVKVTTYVCSLDGECYAVPEQKGMFGSLMACQNACSHYPDAPTALAARRGEQTEHSAHRARTASPLLP